VSAAVASVLLAAAAGASWPVPTEALLRRVGGSARAPAARRTLPRWGPAVSAAVLGVLLAGGSVLVVLAVGVAAATLAHSLVRRSRRRAETRSRAQVVELVSGLAGELRGGAEPRAALAAVAGPFPEVATAARSPATDPAVALHRAAEVPGQEALADLAAAWRVATATGAGLAAVAGRLAATARAEDAVRRELDAQLAGPRSTAVLLALLPAAGVLLGAGLGADPLGFLLTTTAGGWCLLAGVGLVGAGVGWTDLIVARAARP
jgi:tight adherence protein B